MSGNQELIFTIVCTVIFSIPVYVAYSASRRTGKSFLYFLLFAYDRWERKALLTKSEVVMEYCAIGIGVVFLAWWGFYR